MPRWPSVGAVVWPQMVPKSPAPKRAGCLTAPHQAFSVQSFSASFRGKGPSQSGYPHGRRDRGALPAGGGGGVRLRLSRRRRSEEHTSELQSQSNLVCRLLLEKKKKKKKESNHTN